MANCITFEMYILILITYISSSDESVEICVNVTVFSSLPGPTTGNWSSEARTCVFWSFGYKFSTFKMINYLLVQGIWSLIFS